MLEIKVLFSNLNHLCKSVEPNMLRPLIMNSLEVAYKLSIKENGDTSFLFELLEDLHKTLLDEIHDANRILIGQIIEEFCEQISGGSEVKFYFDVFSNRVD